MPTIPTTQKICPVDAGIPSLFEPSAGAELVDQKIGHLHIKTIIRWILLLQIFQNLFSFTVLIQCLQNSCQNLPEGQAVLQKEMLADLMMQQAASDKENAWLRSM